MLKIINDLQPFFEDCYRRINVREYSRMMKCSPPTASSKLKQCAKEELLNEEPSRQFKFYYANRENKQFIDLSRIYWSGRLKPLAVYLEKQGIHPGIVVYGSLAKGETTKDSDIDIALFSHKKKLSLQQFENQFKRKIHILGLPSLSGLKNKELANNIANGYILQGRVKA